MIVGGAVPIAAGTIDVAIALSRAFTHQTITTGRAVLIDFAGQFFQVHIFASSHVWIADL